MKTTNQTPARQTTESRTAPAVALNRLVRRVRYHLRKGRSLILPANVWEGAKAKDYEHDGDVVNRIAEKAGCDWLINNTTREAHFFV